MKTRDRILSTIIDAFNDNGFHAYSLTDLAGVCNMSRGNLAYHYKNKEAILDDISVKMIRDIKRFKSRRKDYIAFYNLSLDIRTLRSLQKWYTFVFRDMSVLEHTPIKDVLTNWSKEVIKSNLNAFAYGIDVGNVQAEPYEGLYYQLSVNAWLITYYWIAQQEVRELHRDDEAERMVWSTIIPHFTEKGIGEFLEFYGENSKVKFGIPIGHYMDLQHLI
jgi:AcrR family transcriptional regulator